MTSIETMEMVAGKNGSAVSGELVDTADPGRQPSPGDKAIAIRPKVFLNGFPKSGLHLLVNMGRCIVENKAHEYPWAGSFAYNAWSVQWLTNPNIFPNISRLTENAWLKGHMGYKPDIEQYMFHHGVSHTFIYRDLRDVLVSQSFHVIAEDDQRFYHPEKEIYRSMPEHRDVIMACLTGIGPYAGIIDRWRLYEPWTRVPWTNSIKYEDLINDPHGSAYNFVLYNFTRMGWANGIDVAIPHEIMNEAVSGVVKAMGRKDASATFRKGVVGGWREWFDDEIRAEFRRRGGDEILVRLGYEKDGEW